MRGDLTLCKRAVGEVPQRSLARDGLPDRQALLGIAAPAVITDRDGGQEGRVGRIRDPAEQADLTGLQGLEVTFGWGAQRL